MLSVGGSGPAVSILTILNGYIGLSVFPNARGMVLGILFLRRQMWQFLHTTFILFLVCLKMYISFNLARVFSTEPYDAKKFSTEPCDAKTASE